MRLITFFASVALFGQTPHEIVVRLASPDLAERFAALAEIDETTYRKKEIRDIVHDIVANDPVPGVRRSAINTVRMLEKDPNYARHLVKHLKDPELKLAALKAIAMLDSHRDDVRIAAISFLGDNDALTRATGAEVQGPRI